MKEEHKSGMKAQTDSEADLPLWTETFLKTSARLQTWLPKTLLDMFGNAQIST